MREAPERIWAMSEKDERGGREAFGYFRNTAILNPDWHDRNYYHQQVEYVRADLSDALLREAVEALICVIPTHRFVGNFCWCPAARDADAGHTADCLKARATLAKLREHLGETE